MMHFLNTLRDVQEVIQLGYAFFCVIIIYQTARRGSDNGNDRAHIATFLIVSCAVFVQNQLPLIAFNWRLNVDEAQMAANAIRFVTTMNSWNSVDTTTSGPL